MENTANAKMPTFPAFHRVDGRRVIIVGGGEEAASKLRLLSETAAKLVVFAPKVDEAMARALTETNATHFARDVEAADFICAALCFTALETEEADCAVVDLAKQMGVAVNAVDRPHLCDFITPSIVNRSPVVVAVSTNGAAPVLARRLKARIETLLHPATGTLARFADGLRGRVANVFSSGVERRRFWEFFFDGPVSASVLAGDLVSAKRESEQLLGLTHESEGFVSLIGAGPGAEDLLTIRAHRALQNADVILRDALVSDEVVRLGRRDAEVISVGKRKGCHSKSQDEINALIVSQARLGKRVVRLKSGDPMIFGRAGEEIAAMRSAGIAYEIVPGITSALAAAAEAEIPLTLRGTASSVVFTTGHDLNSELLPDWAALAQSGATIAVYMGRSVAKGVAERLQGAGLSADTPVAILENVSRGDRTTTIGTLSGLAGVDAPKSNKAALILIGEAIAGAKLDGAEVLAQEFIQSPAQHVFEGASL